MKTKQLFILNRNIKKTVALIFFVPIFIYMVGQIMKTSDDKRFDSGQLGNMDHILQSQYLYPKKDGTSGAAQSNDNLQKTDGVTKNDLANQKTVSTVIEGKAATQLENIDVEELPNDETLLASFLMDYSISGEYRSAVIRKLLTLGKKNIIMDLISSNSDMPPDLNCLFITVR